RFLSDLDAVRIVAGQRQGRVEPGLVGLRLDLHRLRGGAEREPGRVLPDPGEQEVRARREAIEVVTRNEDRTAPSNWGRITRRVATGVDRATRERARLGAVRGVGKVVEVHQRAALCGVGDALALIREACEVLANEALPAVLLTRLGVAGVATGDRQRDHDRGR